MTDVHLLRLPVRIWAQSQEHTDALLREFALITLGATEPPDVPARLLELMESISLRYLGSAAHQEKTLCEAADAGLMVLEDLRYDVSASVVPVLQALEVMFEEADAYCAQGQHLLTLEASREVVRFRRWLLAQFVDQVAGRPAVAWPAWP